MIWRVGSGSVCSAIDQIGHSGAWPRPAAKLADRLFINGNNHRRRGGKRRADTQRSIAKRQFEPLGGAQREDCRDGHRRKRGDGERDRSAHLTSENAGRVIFFR